MPLGSELVANTVPAWSLSVGRRFFPILSRSERKGVEDFRELAVKPFRNTLPDEPPQEAQLHLMRKRVIPTSPNEVCDPTGHRDERRPVHVSRYPQNEPRVLASISAAWRSA